MAASNPERPIARGRRAIFLTGAGSGMGAATARLFADKGWFIGGYDIDPTALARVANELGPAAGVFETLDVTDQDAFGAAIARFGVLTAGRLDILYNNAGVIAQGRFENMAWDAIERVVRVNLFGPIIGIRAALPLLKATKNALCFTTCSASAIFGASELAIYSASKHAVRGLTEALAAELAIHGIRVGDVLPGIIETGMVNVEQKASRATQGMWRLLPPSAVADAVWAAYHMPDTPLHTYVPPELIDYEHAALETPGKIVATAEMRMRAIIAAEHGGPE